MKKNKKKPEDLELKNHIKSMSMLIKINNKTQPTKPVYAVEFYSNDTLMLRVPSWSMAQNDELISQWGRLFEFTVVKL